MIVSHIFHRDSIGRISTDGRCLPRTEVDKLWFRSHIAGKMAVVGSRTYKELPESVIRSLGVCNVLNHGNPWSEVSDGCLEWATQSNYRELMVLGGAHTFKVTADCVSRVYLTETLTGIVPTSDEDVYWTEPYGSFRTIFEQRVGSQVFKIMEDPCHVPWSMNQRTSPCCRL